MTRVTMAVRNLLAQDTDLRALLGSSQHWDTWIFDSKPYVRLENKSKALIVINEDGQWAQPNQYSTQRFPRLLIDVWADPTRNDDLSVKRDDAQDKIEAITALVNKHLHTVSLHIDGHPIIWGTADEMANFTGLMVMGSSWLTGPTYSPVSDAQGAWMGRSAYALACA